MKQYLKYFTIALIFMIAVPLKAQSILSYDFESNTIGDTLFTIGWSVADIQSVVVDDPLASGNKVLRNTVHNYNAAPVFMFVLPVGKTLADYDSLTFKGYFQKGDVGYKDIVAQAYQTKPTGHHFLDTDTLGIYNRALGVSSAWENISLNISNTSAFSDTVYIALGINCSGVSGTDTTTWFADDVQLMAKTQTQSTSILSLDFESYNIGDSLDHISWSPSDIQSVIVDDPLASGNKVLRNTVHNYNAAPVLMFVLPTGKTLADYDTLTFKGYFEKGDVGYKDIIAQAYQTKPTGHFLDTDTLGLYSRAQGVSTAWENISLNINNTSSFSDTVYIALGISCAGTSGTDTTTWYADDVQLVAKVNNPPPPPPITLTVTNGGFEDSPVGIDTSGSTKGWLFQVASGISPTPEFEIVSDTVEEGNRALKVTVHGLGTNQWDIQAVNDSIHIAPGGTYYYSIWAKANKAGAQVNFTIGNYAYSEYGAIRPANLTTQWKKYSIQFSVNDGQNYIRAPIHFGYAADSGNVIYIDNLQIDTISVYHGPQLAQGADRFLGNVKNPISDNDFADYWTQLTPGNEGKWGTVATTMDTTQWNWGGLDDLYNYAKSNNLIFKDHCLIWGQQQPSWISSLDSTQQINYIETWIRMVGQRYPNIDMIDVVNEALTGHNPPDGTNGNANYENALGGKGTTGWDWVINAFKLARKYLPNSKLLINDYGIINDNSATTTYLQLINLLKDSLLIDGIGVQGHRFELENADTITLKSNLQRLGATGLPVYISEMDLGNIGNTGTPDDNQQLQLYQKIFPVLWESPAVKGITLWGYKEGEMWQTTCYLVQADNKWRPALTWLAQYIKDNPTGVERTVSTIPANYRLDQNFPNPFNPSTKIRYSIVKASRVTLKIYDILGREILTLVNENQLPGQYTVTFDAKNLASGVYFYRLNAGNFSGTKKLMLLK
jgi:GH35 family endo-1,4-beta-xylanase